MKSVVSPLPHVGSDDVADLRRSLGKLGVIVAQVDLDFRYVWIDNPHPDFDAAAVVGKTDADLLPAEEAEGIMRLKRQAIEKNEALSQVLTFQRSDGPRQYKLTAYPIREHQGKCLGLLTAGFNVSTT